MKFMLNGQGIGDEESWLAYVIVKLKSTLTCPYIYLDGMVF